MPVSESPHEYSAAATRVVRLAQEEAKGFGVSTVGDEFILLGLIREEEGKAAHLLESRGITLERAREALSAQIGEKALPESSSRMLMSTAARQVLEFALEEAEAIHRQRDVTIIVDTEHLLLGLLSDKFPAENGAVRLLGGLGIARESLREAVISELNRLSR